MWAVVFAPAPGLGQLALKLLADAMMPIAHTLLADRSKHHDCLSRTVGPSRRLGAFCNSVPAVYYLCPEYEGVPVGFGQISANREDPLGNLSQRLQ